MIERRTPLRRKTPLRAKTEKIAGKQREAFWRLSRQIVLWRDNQRCQLCGNAASDVHHVFGRAGTGARLGYPWCHLPELCAALCRLCHGGVHDGRIPGQKLRLAALSRFADRFRLEEAPTFAGDLRQAVERLARDGLTPLQPNR